MISGWINSGWRHVDSSHQEDIAIVRDVAECMALLIQDANPPDVRQFILSDPRAEALRAQFRAVRASCVRCIERKDLCQIEEVCGVTLPPPRPVDARAVLGRSWEEYAGLEYWKPGWTPPVPSLDGLDAQLALSLHGRFADSERLLNKIRAADPGDDRAAFNAGWFAMRDGDLQRAGELLDRGRRERVFGNPFPPSSAPVIGSDTDIRGKTVLFHGEGGFGDQIFNIHFVDGLKERGAKVVVSCSGELHSIFARMKNVDAVVSEHAASVGVYHDYRLPGMSAPWLSGRRLLPEGYLRADPAYVDKWKIHANKIGVCYHGNNKFEHEQHRVFPRELMDRAVGSATVSLQYGENDGIINWEDTAGIIANLRLVVTSCTAVAHLAAAMGRHTWIVLPILPYYTWAQPGVLSKWYSSVRLFRQTTYGDWEAPFNAIRRKLHELI